MSEEIEGEVLTTEKAGFTTFDEALKNEDFSKSLMKYVDSAVSRGVETYKTKNFQEAVEKGVTEKIEASKYKTPDQLQMIEMQKTMSAMKEELAAEKLAKIRSTNKNLALKGLSEKGLPSGLSDFIITDTEETTLSNLDNITQIINDYQQGIKSENLKNNNIIVPTGDTTTLGTLKEPGDGASKEEWKQYWKNKNNGGQ